MFPHILIIMEEEGIKMSIKVRLLIYFSPSWKNSFVIKRAKEISFDPPLLYYPSCFFIAFHSQTMQKKWIVYWYCGNQLPSIYIYTTIRIFISSIIAGNQYNPHILYHTAPYISRTMMWMKFHSSSYEDDKIH